MKVVIRGLCWNDLGHASKQDFNAYFKTGF